MSSKHSIWFSANPSLCSLLPLPELLADDSDWPAAPVAAAEIAAENAAAAACRALADGDRPKAVLHLVDALIHTETADNLENEAHSDRNEGQDHESSRSEAGRHLDGEDG